MPCIFNTNINYKLLSWHIVWNILVCTHGLKFIYDAGRAWVQRCLLWKFSMEKVGDDRMGMRVRMMNHTTRGEVLEGRWRMWPSMRLWCCHSHPRGGDWLHSIFLLPFELVELALESMQLIEILKQRGTVQTIEENQWSTYYIVVHMSHMPFDRSVTHCMVALNPPSQFDPLGYWSSPISSSYDWYCCSISYPLYIYWCDIGVIYRIHSSKSAYI